MFHLIAYAVKIMSLESASAYAEAVALGENPMSKPSS